MKKLILSSVVILIALATIARASTYGNLEVYLIKQPINYDLEQRIYTPICLAECHMVLNFSWHGSSFTLQKTDLSYFKNKIVGIDNLQNLKVQYLANQSYQDTVCTSFNNSDTHDCLATQQVTKYQSVWKDLPDTIPITQDRWYQIDLIGYKNPSTTPSAVDIIPIIKGINLNEYAWWNTSFSKCQNITLNYVGANSTLTNMQVYLNITKAASMSSDYSDLRFVNASCNVNSNSIELDHWNEAYNSNYWLGYVEVDSITNTSNRVISVYYGNSTPVSSTSSAANTFVNGWDWESGATTGWSTQNGGDIAVQTTYRNNNSASAYGVQVTGGSGWEVAYATINTVAISTKKKYIWYLYWNDNAHVELYNWVRDSTLGHNIFNYKVATTGQLLGFPPWTATGVFLTLNKWHKITVVGSAAGGWNFSVDYLNGTISSWTGGTGENYAGARIGFGQDDSAATAIGDPVLVLNYNDTAITNSFGSEQSSSTATTTSLTINGTAGNVTHVYGSADNLTANTTTGLNIQIQVNGTNVSTGTTLTTTQYTFPVGVWNVTAYTTGNSSFDPSSKTYWATITQAPTSMSLYLDGTQANKSKSYNLTAVNATGVINVTGLPVSIDVNKTYKAMGTTLMEYDQVYGAGLYNITSYYAGNANYSASSKTYWLNISQAANVMYFSLANSSYTVVADTWDGTWLYANGTDYGGNQFLHLVYPDPIVFSGGCSGGSYNMTLNNTYNITNYLNSSYLSGYSNRSEFELYCWGNANYSTNKSYIYSDIAKGTPNLVISSNSSNPATAGTIINLTCTNNGTVAGVNFYNDTAAITDPFILNTTSLLGTYNYTCNTTATGNWTAASTNYNQTILLVGGLQIVQIDDEKTQTPLTFNVTIYNSTFSTTQNNILTYNNNSVKGSLIITISKAGYIPRNYYANVPQNGSYSFTGYLLDSSSGVYVTYWAYSTINPVAEPGAYIRFYRFINSSFTDVAESQADFQGKGTMYLDPYGIYNINAQTLDGSLTKNLTSYNPNPSFILQISFGGTTTGNNITGLWVNTNYSVTPTDVYLRNASILTPITYTISDGTNSTQWYALQLIASNGTVLYFNNQTTSSGGTIAVNLNYSSLTNYVIVQTFFQKQGFSLFQANRSLIIWKTSSAIPDALNFATTQSGLALPVLAVIAVFCSFGLASVASRVVRTGAGLIYLAVLTIFSIYNFFPIGMMIGLFMLEIGIILYREAY